MTAHDLHRDAGRAAHARRLLTLDEYYAFEEDNPIRHEYVRGEVFATSPGVRRSHGKIAMNIAAKLHLAAGDGPCRVYQSDVKVQIGDDTVYCPDVMAACGPEPDNPHIEDAPCFVAEVLSGSTRATDLRDKAPNYRRLASLQLLLVVEQSVYRGVTFPPPPRRVREGSPPWDEGWGGEEVPEWMIDPADRPEQTGAAVEPAEVDA